MTDIPVLADPVGDEMTAATRHHPRQVETLGDQLYLGAAAKSTQSNRIRVHGKFLAQGERKFWLRGVTYGTFRDNADGLPFPDAAQVERDFAQMATNGFNTVRVYTPPPVALLDSALLHGLQVMVGLPWEQHVAFLDDPKTARAIVARMRAAVRPLAQHCTLRSAAPRSASMSRS